MKSLTIALMMPLLLSACAPAHSNAGLSVIEYSREVQENAATEMENGQCTTLNTFMNDYSVLRDQARI